MYWGWGGGLTFGCQWSSRKPPGSSLTTAPAMVFAMGKFRESIIARVPAPPGTVLGGRRESL